MNGMNEYDNLITWRHKLLMTSFWGVYDVGIPWRHQVHKPTTFNPAAYKYTKVWFPSLKARWMTSSKPVIVITSSKAECVYAAIKRRLLIDASDVIKPYDVTISRSFCGWYIDWIIAEQNKAPCFIDCYDVTVNMTSHFHLHSDASLQTVSDVI